ALAVKATTEVQCRLKALIDYFGDRPLAEIRTGDVEDFVAHLESPRTVQHREGRTLSTATINRHLTRLRHMFNWAIGREYLERTPFRRGTETLITLAKEKNRRHRRIAETEEQHLIAHAPANLRSMIVA